MPAACTIGIGVSFLGLTAAYFALFLIGPLRILLYNSLIRPERETERSGGPSEDSNAGTEQGE